MSNSNIIGVGIKAAISAVSGMDMVTRTLECQKGLDPIGDLQFGLPRR